MGAKQLHILSTKPDHPSTDIAGVRTLPADGKGGILLTEAAQSMAELQDENGKPLTGQALVKAAENFAEARDLRVSAVSEAKAAKLPELNGATADRPPAVEVAQEAHAALYGDGESDDEPDTAQPAEAQPPEQTTEPVPADQA